MEAESSGTTKYIFISLHVRLLIHTSVYYIKLKSRLSVRLSVCLSDRHAGISAMSAWIEAGLARNGS